jgi:hypothetical protein
VEEISGHIGSLSAEDVRVVRVYEERNKNRETLLEQLDRGIRVAPRESEGPNRLGSRIHNAGALGAGARSIVRKDLGEPLQGEIPRIDLLGDKGRQDNRHEQRPNAYLT